MRPDTLLDRYIHCGAVCFALTSICCRVLWGTHTILFFGTIIFLRTFLANRDMGLITMTQQLQSLDEICSSTTKRFMQFENEYAWHGQPMRRKILLRILKRYKSIPRITELTNIEEDLSWSDFCLWYANRNKIINQLELEFSDFVEDQREKEGRLFYRWHKSLYRAKEAFEAAEALAAASAAALNGSSNDVGDTNVGPNVRRGSQPPRVSISQVNSFRTFDNRNSFSGPDGPSEEPNNTASTATSGVVKERGGSSDSLEATSNNAASNATNTKGEIAPSNASGAQPAGGPSDGIIALKVTPFSIKAFIKYFANDIIGVQYEIPKDCMAANLALTEALFFRYCIASFIYFLIYSNNWSTFSLVFLLIGGSIRTFTSTLRNPCTLVTKLGGSSVRCVASWTPSPTTCHRNTPQVGLFPLRRRLYRHRCHLHHRRETSKFLQHLVDPLGRCTGLCQRRCRPNQIRRRIYKGISKRSTSSQHVHRVRPLRSLLVLKVAILNTMIITTNILARVLERQGACRQQRCVPPALTARDPPPVPPTRPAAVATLPVLRRSRRHRTTAPP